MKIIFSRKGFDTGSGGCPSPIIDGIPYSLPIPGSEMFGNTRNYGNLVNIKCNLITDLTNGKFSKQNICHLDPDINITSVPRLSEWRGSFGQAAAAQGHLRNQNVANGDIFLFWGLFQEVEFAEKWKFIGMPKHMIWGWMQIGEILSLGKDGSHILEIKPWLEGHPYTTSNWDANNTIYVASDVMQHENWPHELASFGTFKQGYQLTQENMNVSTWNIPKWLNPKHGGSGMTYHRRNERWSEDTVKIVNRGQEFVTPDLEKNRQAIDWVFNLIKNHAYRPR